MIALVDTSALLALSRLRDQYHEDAIDVSDRHLAAGGRFVGTTMVLGELYGHLLHLRGPSEARTALELLLDDPVHEWVDPSVGLIRDAVTGWLARFADQRFTLVDAVSFEVMRLRGISSAFAFDAQFRIAGFELLE